MPNNTPQKRVTLRDIARALDISHSSVSLALRNHPRVSQSLRLKIQQKAEELGYTPDPMLSALAKYRLNNSEQTTTLTLAFINSFDDPKILRETREFSLYLDGAKNFALNQGYKFEEFTTAELPPSRLDSILKTRGIRGLLLSPPSPKHPTNWGNFPWSDYASVRFGRNTQAPNTHFVTSAQDSNAIRAFDHIREKGYQRIGFVTRYRRRRLFGSGFLWAQFEQHHEKRIPLTFLNPTANIQEDQLAALKQWLDLHQPDAILTDNPFLLNMLTALNIHVPNDLALATTSLHDTVVDTGIDQKPTEIGQAAARTLISLLNSNSLGIPETINEVLIQGRWVDGSMLPHKKT